MSLLLIISNGALKHQSEKNLVWERVLTKRPEVEPRVSLGKIRMQENWKVVANPCHHRVHNPKLGTATKLGNAIPWPRIQQGIRIIEAEDIHVMWLFGHVGRYNSSASTAYGDCTPSSHFRAGGMIGEKKQIVFVVSILIPPL